MFTFTNNSILLCSNNNVKVDSVGQLMYKM